MCVCVCVYVCVHMSTHEDLYILFRVCVRVNKLLNVSNSLLY